MDREHDSQVRITQTSCYFCSEWLEGATFQSHIAKCGQVLEKCAICQDVYVQRKLMNQHLDKCNKKARNGSSAVTSNGHASSYFEDRLRILEEDASSLRAALNDEVRLRLTVVTELGNLKKRNQIAEEWTSKVGEVLTTLKKCINEETDSRAFDMKDFRFELDKLLLKFNSIEEWRQETTMLLDRLQSDVVAPNDRYRNQMEALINNNSVTIHKIQQLEADMDDLKATVVGHHAPTTNHPSPNNYNHFAEKMNAVDQVFQDQQALINSVRNYLTTEVNNLKEENLKLRLACDENTGLVQKFQALDFDVKGMRNIVFETEDKCEKFDKTIMQTKQDMADLEVHLTYQEKLLPIHNTKGRLIWRIPEYKKKLSEAKDEGVILKSPIFSTRQYGYNLRLEVCLNGVGTWKGRNIIASLTIVPGDYDTLLTWPCKIEADILLRDQPADLTKANDLKKMVIAKRKGEESLNASIHIPHKILQTSNYLRDDAIIFDVRIIKCTN